MIKRAIPIIVILTIIIVLIILIDKSIESKFQDGNTCETNTNTYRLYTGVDGQRMVLFSFLVEGEEYESSYQLNSEMESNINGILTIEYVCDNPRTNRLIFPN